MARAAAEAAAAGQQVASDVARTVAQLCVGQTTETSICSTSVRRASGIFSLSKQRLPSCLPARVEWGRSPLIYRTTTSTDSASSEGISAWPSNSSMTFLI